MISVSFGMDNDVGIGSDAGNSISGSFGSSACTGIMVLEADLALVL